MEVKSNPSNAGGHLYKPSKYAHFSQVTNANKHRFSLFEKASPMEFTIQKGECLVIPKGWWHHVKSFGSRCLSVNFWYANGESPSLSLIPLKISNAISQWLAFQLWTNEYLIQKIDKALPGGVWLILDQFAARKPISVANFVSRYSSGSEYAYLITPTDFEKLPDGEINNKHILKILADDFTVPFPEKMLNADANFWMNFGGLDTGLHFDDEDGLLCVVDGYKEVTLYPPTDTPYLYPYPIEPLTLQRSHHRFMPNLYKKGPLLHTTSTMTNLLEICLAKAPNVANIAQKLQERYGVGKIVYGIKNFQGVVRYEFYFYGIHSDFHKPVETLNFYKDAEHNSQWELSKYLEFHQTLFPQDTYDISKVVRQGLCIFSIDLTEEDVILGRTPCLNLYYTLEKSIQAPFVLLEKTLQKNGDQVVRSVVLTDTYESVFLTAQKFADRCCEIKLDPPDILNLLEFVKPTNYGCVAVSIFNKGPQIGLYFYGVFFPAFMDFLHRYDYPCDLVAYCRENAGDLAQHNLEIGFHFEKGSTTAVPLRTAFYGVF